MAEWGTLEELILAAAVNRHGTRAWSKVASEVRIRSNYPSSFTPQVCEKRYKVLQKNYHGCKDLLEDLKQKRMEELRRDIAKADDRIGSLKTKVANLKALSHNSQIDSATPAVKSDAVDSSGKEGFSAGSFTEDVSKITKSDSKAKPETSAISDDEKDLTFSTKAQRSNVKKKRGRRKKKLGNVESKEGSNGDSENLGSENVATSAMGSTSSKDPKVEASVGKANDYLMGIFNSIAENDVAMVFRRKLDGQKRARYRKVIKRHLDFDTLRSRIANSSMTSVRQLFRDLLVLANNALVFYSKKTREYKSAHLLRGIITHSYKIHCRAPRIRTIPSLYPVSDFWYVPVKPRSRRNRNKSRNLVPVDNNTESSVDAVLEISNRLSNIFVEASNEAEKEKDEVKKVSKGAAGSGSRQGKGMKNEKKRSGRRRDLP